MTTSRINDAEMHTLFNVFDIDDSGFISPLELSNSFRCLGWTDISIDECENLVVQHFGPELQLRADAIVTEGGLYPTMKERLGINFDQFKTLVESVQLPADSPAECFEAFKLFDMSRVGKIAPCDLKCVGGIVTGRTVSDALVCEIMRLTDNDLDGFLSLDEFRQAVSKGGKGTECGHFDMPNQEMFIYPSAPDSESQSFVLESGEAKSLNIADRCSNSFRRARERPPATNEARTRIFGGVKILVGANSCVTKEAVREALGEFGYGPDTLDDETFDTIFKEQDVKGEGMIDVKAYIRLLQSISEDATELVT